MQDTSNNAVKTSCKNVPHSKRLNIKFSANTYNCLFVANVCLPKASWKTILLLLAPIPNAPRFLALYNLLTYLNENRDHLPSTTGSGLETEAGFTVLGSSFHTRCF